MSIKDQHISNNIDANKRSKLLSIKFSRELPQWPMLQDRESMKRPKIETIEEEDEKSMRMSLGKQITSLQETFSDDESLSKSNTNEDL